MKHIIKFWPSSFVLMVVLTMLNYSCKKADNNGNNTNNPPENVSDIDGNIYHSVSIGTQVWMVENLKTTKFNDGTAIPMVIPDSIWEFLITPAYCWYNNDETIFKNPYGALYNWYTVNTGKLAPKGWHVPSDADWQVLVDFLGGTLVGGGKMKEIDTIHWHNPNEGATNSSGFSGIPGGSRDEGSMSIGIYGFMWSSTEYDASFSYDRTLFNNTPYVFRNIIPKTFGLSVRCLRD